MTHVLAIAGWDSTGWSGLAADLRTLQHLGCAAQGLITAMTEQSAASVHHICPRSSEELSDDLAAILGSRTPDAVKVGMVATATNARTIATALETLDCPIVVDPIHRSSSGHPLFGGEAPELMPLLRLATLITPNWAEATWLLGEEQPGAWCARVGTAMLRTNGGHDTLFLPCGATHELRVARVPGADPAGTGCTLSSALTAHLASGPTDLLGAAQAAVTYTAAQVALVGPGPRSPLLHRDG